MKNLSFKSSFIFLLFLSSIGAYSQVCLTGDFAPPIYKSTSIYESKNGITLPASGVIRILFVFAEYDYVNGGDPCPSGTTGWPAHSLPTWANNLTDVYSPSGAANGVLTRYFQIASSGNYTVLGDYVLAPDNGGIFKVPITDTIPINPNNTSLIPIVNSKMNNNIVTAHNLNSINNFDLWTCTDGGLPKITPSTESPKKYDNVIFIWRNSKYQGTGYASSSSPGVLLGYNSNTYCCFGTYENIPTQIMIHEYAHLIYGGNNFHCGGGGSFTGGDYFIPSIGGWSNLGLSGASLLSWNAWDRQRLNWKAPGNQFLVSARNTPNNGEINGDLDATIPAQAGIFTIRDFVTTGDAIRIKLPFIDPLNEYPEYLWIENHNTVSKNQNQWDKFIYQDGYSCVQPAVYGLYSYLQIDREIRSSTSYNDVFGGYAYYLRPLTANGYFDRVFGSDSILNNCVNSLKYRAFTLSNENPLTGGGDQETYSINKSNDNILSYDDHIGNTIEYKDGVYNKNLFELGHSRHAFTLTGNKKIGIGTNPPSSSMMNMVGYNYPGPSSAKNVRKVSLNGVSVEIINQNSDGTMQVRVRFDDIEVGNNIRWCADTIALNPVASPSGYSLNLLTGKTITLDQGTTDTRMSNPIIFNGKQVFASPTIFKCKTNSWFNMSVNSNVILLNQSSLILEAGSKLDVNDGSAITINTGCTFYIKSGANLNIYGSGKIDIKPGAFICSEPGANINLQNYNSLIILEDGANYGANPVLFTSPSCAGSITKTGNGAIADFNQDVYIQDQTISTNRYIGGKNIYVGNHVTTSQTMGDVLINNSANVVFNCKTITFDTGFECSGGSTYETINH